MSNDIVVVGRLIKEPSGAWLIDIDRLRSVGDSSLWEDIERSEYGHASDNDSGMEWKVDVDLADDANLPGAQQAAQNLVRALLKIEAALNDLYAGTPINWNGRSMTAGSVLAELKRTDFKVTDSSYTNGGPGAAQRWTSQDNIVEVNWRYFDGNLSNSEGADYADHRYVGDAGLIGILLHELAHVTQFGSEFNNASLALYKREHGSMVGYAGSDYHQNNEAFVNGFAVNAAAAMHLNINQLADNWRTDSVEPLTIYNTNMGHAPIVDYFLS